MSYKALDSLVGDRLAGHCTRLMLGGSVKLSCLGLLCAALIGSSVLYIFDIHPRWGLVGVLTQILMNSGGFLRFLELILLVPDDGGGNKMLQCGVAWPWPWQRPRRSP